MIHELELCGFKSYKRVEKVGPFARGFNCVVGLNGMGKSESR